MSLGYVLSRCEPDPFGGCLLWTGALGSGNGYPKLSIDGEKGVYGHVWVWEEINGPLPPDKIVCHTCDVRPCLNERHLYAGSYSDNLNDAYERGRRAGYAGPLVYGFGRPQTKLSDAQVRLIRADLRSKTVIAAELGVSWTTVHDIQTGRRRRILGYA